MKFALVCVVVLFVALSASAEDEDLITTTETVMTIPEVTTEVAGIHKFRKNIGTSMRTAHSQVRNGLMGIRDRVLSKTTTTPAPVEFDKVENERDEEDDRPVWEADVKEAKKDNSSEELDNRFLIDAPVFCPSGQRMAGGRCRAIA